MTWSIIARDRDTGQFGIAVATFFFAAGALVPHVKSRVGAIATQALVNPFYGTDGLRLLEQGATAPDVVRKIIAVSIMGLLDPALVMAGEEHDPATIEQIRRQYHLD